MATLANQGVASQASFGQLGSGFIDNTSHFIPADGSVVVAITCLGDTVFDVLIRSFINRIDGLSLTQEKVEKFANSVNYIPRSFAWIDP